MPQYTYRAEWSPDDDSYLGRCLEFPTIWRRGPTAAEAIANTECAVIEEVRTSLADDWPLPEPLTDRRYSGKFMVRMPTSLHASLAVEAVEQGVSLNQWVLHKLTNRPVADF